MKVFAVPDTHFPYANKKDIDFVIKAIKEEEPDVVVQLGDLLDQYSFSSFSRNLNLTTPVKELREGLRMAKDLWKRVTKICSMNYQLLGNHDVRALKRIKEKLPELVTEFNLLKLYSFENVKTMGSDRDCVVLDGVVYTHGWLGNSNGHCSYFSRPVVHGHLHRPTIVYNNPKLWSMDAGFLGDTKRLPFNYTPSTFSKWTKACGVVDSRKPKLIIL